jgi:DNA-binding transcriptional MerR regulator
MPYVEIPSKLYFRIGEVSRLLEIPAHVVRYWETEFPSLRPKKATSKHRLFRKHDVDTLFTIKRLLYEEKYTIAGARRRLEELKAEEAGIFVEEKKAPAPKKRSLAIVPVQAKDPVLALREELEAFLRFLDADEEEAPPLYQKNGGATVLTAE